MTLAKVLNRLMQELDAARANSERIRKPYSWALYQTWKWCDEHEREKKNEKKHDE